MEESLINKLIQEDPSAYKTFVDAKKNKVFNTCYGFLHNRQDADDVSQEVFIEVFQSIGRFNRESSLSTWIYRIAVNKSLDFLRKAKRKKRWAELTRIGTSENDNQDEWYGHDETPDIALEQKERMEALKKAVDGLPTNQKAAFNLHKYEELSYKEIAEILETSVPSVESLMHRAKNNLKKRLTKFYQNEKK